MIPLLDPYEHPYMDSPVVEALAHYVVVVHPDKLKAHWCAGSPSVLINSRNDVFMAVRMREADSQPGKRGYEIRILRSSDGIHFSPFCHFKREALGVAGFGRPALLKDPRSGKFKLYLCSRSRVGWYIYKFADADDPAEFDPETIKPVLRTERIYSKHIEVLGYKDPVIFWHKDRWHMYACGIDRIDRLHHFKSFDGELWEHVDPLIFIDNSGWHNFSTRASCVIPLPVGFLIAYEGSHHTWNDPDNNVASGLAFSPDLIHATDLTPDYPLLQSTTPGEYFTWRRSDWKIFRNKLYVYFEAALPYNATEIRLSIINFPQAL